MIGWGWLPDDEFRLALSGWLDENYPPDWRKDALRPFRRLRGDDLRNWLRRLRKEGLRAPAWPTEHGGMGLSFARQRIYQEEMERARVARVIDFGEQMLGPVLMAYGTEAQKHTLLPRILSCEDVWCQGYSEPGAGSDLAALSTRADLRATASSSRGRSSGPPTPRTRRTCSRWCAQSGAAASRTGSVSC